MKGKMVLTAMLGIVALLVMGIACVNGDATTSPDPDSSSEQMMEQASAATAASTAPRTSGYASGIWVTGEASVTVEPDLILLTVGVETMAETVADARAEAASSMDAVLQSVKAHGIEDSDVQTQSFNIWPRYEYPEEISGGVRTNRQVLVGYTVSNTAIVKIRDVNAVGTIIDDAAEAGGDATRINNVSFSIEDPKPFTTQLREDAVKDAVAKAEHLASLAGVELGDLVFISEESVGTQVERGFADGIFMESVTLSAPTPISGGELQLRLNVQMVFSVGN